MPIEYDIGIRPVGQDEFRATDHKVMGHAFDIHNALGRFCDERVYQEELAHRCRASGHTAAREVVIRVSYRDFCKLYYLDMLVDGGAVYELKTVEALGNQHQKQLIHYLLLTGLHHGKLVNFRPGSVESRFVSTNLGLVDRMDFRLVDRSQPHPNSAANLLCDTVAALLAEWGAFLDLGLYRDALLHFLSGPESGVGDVDLLVEGRVVGTQRMCLLDAESAWHLSGVRQAVAAYENHLVRLLSHTRLKSLHWINFDQRTISFKTLFQ